MDTNQDKLIQQSIDSLTGVYNVVDGDELKLEIHRCRSCVTIKVSVAEIALFLFCCNGWSNGDSYSPFQILLSPFEFF